MNMNKELISQLESLVEFLRHTWQQTRDPKQSEQVKRELLDAQEQLRRVKGE